MANNIRNIQTGVDTSDGTIYSSDVMKGKIGYARGQRIVGTYTEPVVSQTEFYEHMPNGVSGNISIPIIIPDDAICVNVTVYSYVIATGSYVEVRGTFSFKRSIDYSKTGGYFIDLDCKNNLISYRWAAGLNLVKM